MNNWRLISLTNSDYKILAKCLANRLANRLGKVITTIVAEDQVGYIKGRSVAKTLRKIDDVIDFYNLKQRPGMLLALDFRKAFDSISKKLMFTAFRMFGFGNDFPRWVDVLYARTTSSIIYNGWVKKKF